MSTDIEQASSHVQATGTVASSSASSSGPKVSMFAAKSGFVIPKNKLSGSLVPIFRGGKKGAEDSVKEESSKQVQRKTKWGPDLTQDTAVRKGRALAYQTRVNQITQQLSSGTLGTEDDQELFSDNQSASHSLTSEKLKLLELEKREAVGEIIKLNPAYKAPADYKSLLKEEKVPIPIKNYPGFDFIGLIFGTANDTQKRLEKETGARIRVYGRKANTRNEVELTSTDGNEIAGAYEELYVLVSADTYEKVDAAVALIELLITTVSANTASGSATSTVASDAIEGTVHVSQSAMIISAVINQGLAQQTAGSTPALPQGSYEPSQGPWFPRGPTQAPVPPSSGYMAAASSSAPLINRPVQVPPAPVSNMPSLFGPRPIMAGGFASVAQNPPLHPSRPQLPPAVQQQFGPQSASLSNSGIPRNPLIPVLQCVQPSTANPAQYSMNQPSSTGSHPMVHSVSPSLPQSAPPAMFPSGGAMFPSGGSTGWSRPPLNISQPLVVSGPPAAIISPNIISYPASTHLGAATNRPIAVSSFHSAPWSQVGVSAPTPSLVQSSSTMPMNSLMSQPAMLPALPNLRVGSPSISLTHPLPHSGTPTAAANSPNFSSIKPPLVSGPIPQQPNSRDFTFQPHRPQNSAPQMVVRPGGQSAVQNMAPQSQTSSFQPMMHTSKHLPFQDFPRPQGSNQMSQPRAPMSANFAGSPVGPPVPFPCPTLPNPNAVSPATLPQMQPRNFNLAPPVDNPVGPFPPRAGNQMQFQQNFPAPATQLRNPKGPNQPLNNDYLVRPGNPASGPSRTQQVYDPFSPTSMPFNPQLHGDRAKMQKQERDPEYEDLMASVGVK